MSNIYYHYTNRKALTLFLAVVCSVLFISCASTTVTKSWKDDGYKERAQKIALIMVAKNEHNRKMFEGRFAAELNARGNGTIQSYKIIPMEQLPDRELVKSKIKGTDADTVLISRLVNSKAIDAYTPGKAHFTPTGYNNWDSYYALLFVDYGYTSNTEITYIETNLYDIKTEKLIWSAYSKTERTEGEQQLINTFIEVIIKKLSSDNIIR